MEVTLLLDLWKKMDKNDFTGKVGHEKYVSNGCRVLLKMEHQQQRVNDSKSCFSRFTRNKHDFMCQFFGILYIYHLEKGKTVNRDYYIELLVFLEDEIAKKSHEDLARRATTGC